MRSRATSATRRRANPIPRTSRCVRPGKRASQNLEQPATQNESGAAPTLRGGRAGQCGLPVHRGGGAVPGVRGVARNQHGARFALHGRRVRDRGHRQPGRRQPRLLGGAFGSRSRHRCHRWNHRSPRPSARLRQGASDPAARDLRGEPGGRGRRTDRLRRQLPYRRLANPRPHQRGRLQLRQLLALHDRRRDRDRRRRVGDALPDESGPEHPSRSRGSGPVERNRSQCHAALYHRLRNRRRAGGPWRRDRRAKPGYRLQHRHRRAGAGLRDQRHRRTGQHHRLRSRLADRGHGGLVWTGHPRHQPVRAGLRLHHHDRRPDREAAGPVRLARELSRLFPRSLGDRMRWGVVLVLFLFVALIPPLAGLNENLNPDASSRFQIFLGTSALVLALWAISYNLMLGYTGMVSFAHAAYYGVGAYTVALIFKRYHLPILLGLAAAPFAAAAVGLVTGLVAQRAVRLYFSLLTLAISQLLFSIVFSWYDFTGGDNGIAVTIPDQLSDYTTLYYFTAAVVGICLLLMFILVRSPFGAALLSIRENRQRAASIGINVKLYELAVYTVAALFAGVAGGLFVMYQQQAYPEMLYWTANAQPVVVALLGGTTTFLGPAVGAFIYVVLDNSIAKQFPYQFDIILGAIVLGVVLAVPGGISDVPSVFLRLRERFRRGEEAETPPVESAGEAIRMFDVRKALASDAIQAEQVRSGQTLLQIEHLSRSFGGLRAVEDVSLEVRQGDRHAIIGPN